MPNKPKPIKITVTSGVKGQPVTLINQTTGEKQYLTLGATAKLTADAQNFTSGYTTGDIIDIIVSGERIGSGSVTLSSDTGQAVTIATSAITSGVARGMQG